MDFEIVLGKLIARFEANKINYALIGGFALGVYGIVRATNDLDFLIEKKYAGWLKKYMLKEDYMIIYESDNVIQFENPDVSFGSIDFLYAFRKPSVEMLKRAVMKKLFNETINMPILIPEDIIGLKVQSLVNNPQRKFFELEDIRNIMQIRRSELRWDIIEKHFVLFNLSDLFRELRTAYETSD